MIAVDGTDDDVAQVRALNNRAEPEVNALDADALEGLRAICRLRVVRDAPAGVAGFVLTLPSGETYNSLNYQWFSDRFDRFLYVDRVVVSPAAQGRGVGRVLYEDTLAHARQAGWPRVCSEVNVEPPNPRSLAFHDRLGFKPLLDRLNPAEGKTVRMMVHTL